MFSSAYPCLAIFDVGTPELLLILFVTLLLFGGQKLPELAKGLGRSIREFKKASAGIEEELHRAINEEPVKKPQATLPAAEPVHAPATAVAEVKEVKTEAVAVTPAPVEHKT